MTSLRQYIFTPLLTLFLTTFFLPSITRAADSIGQTDKSANITLSGFIGDSALQRLGNGIIGTINELCVDIADSRGENNTISFYFWYQPTNTLSLGGADRTYLFANNFFPVAPTEAISCEKFQPHVFRPDQYYFTSIAPRYPYGLTIFGSSNSGAWSDSVNDLVKTTCPLVTCGPVDTTLKDIYFTGIQKQDPVILVPGILGTKLDLVNANGALNIWPSPEELKKTKDEFLNLLSLGVNGQDLPGRLFNPSEIIQDIVVANLFTKNVYKNILDLFANRGYSSGTLSFQNPYDWRLDLSTTAGTLNQSIQSATANPELGKVDIVAHSMGGLLVREYLRTAPASITDKIGKIIFLGTPNLGSPKSAKVLLYGDDLDISILNEERTRVITQNMPAMYQLLPSQKYLANSGGYIVDARSTTPNTPATLSFAQTKTLLSQAPHNATLATRADSFHQSLDNFSIPANIETYNIVGCGNNDTIGKIVIKDNGKFDIQYILGDKTVPLQSASAVPGQDYVYFSGVKHMDLVKDQGVLDQILNILNGTTTLASGISTSSASCAFDKKIGFASHSPVNLHIYDNQNRHLGPDALGDIEYGIPNSTYDTIGDNHFAVVPDSTTSTYRIVIQAYATGTFDFDITPMTGSSPTKRTSYLNQPLSTASTTATLTYSSGATSPTLSIDNEGNGSVDQNSQPTATVTGTALQDITPPKISLGNLALGTSFYRYAELIPLITAQDTGSGIATLRITFDGRIISPTGALDFFFERLGAHTFRILATDNAGNPAEKITPIQTVSSPDALRSDIARAFQLDWIKTKNAKQDLIDIADKIIKSPGKIQTLGPAFIAELDKKFSNGNINRQGYDVLREDIDWLIRQ